MVELEILPNSSDAILHSANDPNNLPNQQLAAKSDNQQIVVNLMELKSKLEEYKKILHALERDKTTRENERSFLRWVPLNGLLFLLLKFRERIVQNWVFIVFWWEALFCNRLNTCCYIFMIYEGNYGDCCKFYVDTHNIFACFLLINL